MEQLIKKYEHKLFAAGLADPAELLLLGMDDELFFNRPSPRIDPLRQVFEALNINSLLVSKPREPYRQIIRYLAGATRGDIKPQDTETRTFLHSLPVSEEDNPAAIVDALKRRKCVILPSGEIVTYGTVSPEQAFIVYSSVCFATFVKLFADHLSGVRRGTVDEEAAAVIRQVLKTYPAPAETSPTLMNGPFTDENQVEEALAEAGKRTVELGLVDSFFGNVSYRLNDTIYISQTGSSLDELPGCIDPCPMHGGSTSGLTASSELIAHRRIFENSVLKAILHGHPKFAVILSLDCPVQDCEHEGQCHIKCTQNRSIGNIPIVPGEVGAGPHGLCNTLPPAIAHKPGAIVYGHGLFTVGQTDFGQALSSMLAIEATCRDEFLSRAQIAL